MFITKYNSFCYNLPIISCTCYYEQHSWSTRILRFCRWFSVLVYFHNKKKWLSMMQLISLNFKDCIFFSKYFSGINLFLILFQPLPKSIDWENILFIIINIMTIPSSLKSLAIIICCHFWKDHYLFLSSITFKIFYDQNSFETKNEWQVSKTQLSTQFSKGKTILPHSIFPNSTYDGIICIYICLVILSFILRFPVVLF